jgi:hypothetical protein
MRQLWLQALAIMISKQQISRQLPPLNPAVVLNKENTGVYVAS